MSNGPILSSEAATDIRQRLQRATERDMRVLISERSFWRMLWPLVLIAVTLLNVVLACDFMIRVADHDGPVFLFGLTRAEFINAAIATALIVSTSVLMVILGDDSTKGAGASFGRAIGWLVVAGLIAFSVWTALSETATKLQAAADKGTTQGAQIEAARQVTGAADQVARNASLATLAAQRDVDQAQQQAAQARQAWADYQADARQRYSNASDFAWVTNTTHERGPGRPYVAAIAGADSAVEAARIRLDAARGREASAQAAAVDARQKEAQAVAAPSAESTVIKSLATSLGMTPERLVLAWGLVVAILLEVVRYAGSQGTARMLRGAMDDYDAKRGAAETAMRKAAQAQIRAAAQQPATVSPGPVIPPQQAVTQPYEPDTGAYNDPGASYAPPMAAPVQDQGEVRRRAQAQAQYAGKIADALADAANGGLESAGVHHLRGRYGVSIAGAEAIRDALIQHGHAVKGQAGRVDLV